jgi:hypothetical protein
MLLSDIHPLNNGFGLLNEKGETNFFINLISLDLCRGNLQKLHTVEYSSPYINIFVNKADPTTFILNEGEFMQICEIVDKTIIIGEGVEITFMPSCFYDKGVYYLDWYDEDYEELDVRILYMSN